MNKMSIRKIKNFFKTYKGEWLIAIITTVISAIITRIAQKLFDIVNPLIIVLIVMSLIIVFLLLGLLFNLKRLFDLRFSQVNRLLIDQFGFYSLENQYFLRSRHFPEEKMKLAKVFVKQVLPELIEDIFYKNPNLAKLNIIFDSGTTITPIFKILTESDPCFDKEKVTIYTNNLAGIDEIHKFGKLYDSESYLREEDFNLIGGSPLLKYRATTGPITNNFLSSLEQEQKNSKGTIKTLGILTSNWFIVGKNYDRIYLCARGIGHYKFKMKVEDLSEYIVLISPLGKILPINDVEGLNKYISNDQYSAFPISNDKKNKTFLLTTFRSQKSLSPLVNLSRELKKIKATNTSLNYCFVKDEIIYNPSIGTKSEIRNAELPHDYIIENFRDIYGYEIP